MIIQSNSTNADISQRSSIFDSVGDDDDDVSDDYKGNGEDIILDFKENVGEFIADTVDSIPEFFSDINLQGLLDNSSEALGVILKAGKKNRGQKLPDLSGTDKTTIIGLDNKPIKLDIKTSDRINVYHPDIYSLSKDGTYVTENETGEVFPLNVFYASDEDNEIDIVYSLDEDGYLETVRVSPKASEDWPTSEEEFEAEMEKNGKTQNFQRFSNVLVGYIDEDLDLSTAPKFDSTKKISEEDNEMGMTQGDEDHSHHRRTQRTDAFSAFGKTCSTWDFLTVRIATDKKFKDRYPDHKSRAQAIFAEATEIYWKESCVWLYMLSYESTVGNSNWNTPNGKHIDTIFSPSRVYSGCGGYGVLDVFQDTVKARRSHEHRDFWHLFTGANMSWDAAGCAYVNVCRSKDAGYGVNDMQWTNNLRWQAVLFAHELGHNLGLNHHNFRSGRYVMEPTVNNAYYDFDPGNANYVRNKVVYSNKCGWSSGALGTMTH